MDKVKATLASFNTLKLMSYNYTHATTSCIGFAALSLKDDLRFLAHYAVCQDLVTTYIHG